MKKHCPKCQGSMTEGVVIDHKDSLRQVSHWLEGPPVKTWFGLRLKGRKSRPIQTFRCNRCGFLVVSQFEF